MPTWSERLRRRAPRISETERGALEAGTVWIEGELFSGRPDLARILAEPWPELTAAERAFLAGPVEAACRLIDPWRVFRTRELPEELWTLLRSERFFGLTLPPEHGGLGFSPLAASAVFAKLASRSLSLSVVVLIPNSVGPGELLLHHGTPEQQRYYLPRLARGEEIPCFALTESEAGSDAAALGSTATVFRGPDGEPWLRLAWEKRYITLAPVATLLGLAVQLRDPENLLGQGIAPGITVVLVPTATPGVEIGRRHDPLGIPMLNGPTRGHDVLLPASQILGGAAGAGRGWRMLMEALSAGRSISLPAQSLAGVKLTARVAGSYAQVREQFGRPLAAFEGVEEPLARLAGFAYLLEAACVFTCGAVGRGEKPAVVSAILKYQATELARRAVGDAMDVLGGAGICLGPRNLIAQGSIGAPIGITVEGANILTRTLMIFGQGALRCHPWLRRELAALGAGRPGEFAGAALGHFLHAARNLARALAGTAAGGATLGRSPAPAPEARHWRRLALASAWFATLADLAVFACGSALKQREKLSGRLADALAWLFLLACALRRFAAEGRLESDRPLLDWSVEHGLAEAQRALLGVAENLPPGVFGALGRGPLAAMLRARPLGRGPSDVLGAAAAACLARRGADRERLTGGLYWSAVTTEPTGRLDRAVELALAARPLRERRRAARAAGTPEKAVLSAEETELLRAADAARRDALAVDEFTLAEYLGGSAAASTASRAVAGPAPTPR